MFRNSDWNNANHVSTENIRFAYVLVLVWQFSCSKLVLTKNPSPRLINDMLPAKNLETEAGRAKGR